MIHQSVRNVWSKLVRNGINSSRKLNDINFNVSSFFQVLFYETEFIKNLRGTHAVSHHDRWCFSIENLQSLRALIDSTTYRRPRQRKISSTIEPQKSSFHGFRSRSQRSWLSCLNTTYQLKGTQRMARLDVNMAIHTSQIETVLLITTQTQPFRCCQIKCPERDEKST